MGKFLVEESPLFRNALQNCDEVLQGLPDGPSWTMEAEITKSLDASNLSKCLYSQTLCTAVQLGLVLLLRSWGILPTAVLGHSSGEIVAAYTAGLMSFADAIVVAYYRGMHLSRNASKSNQKPNGSMCAVGMSKPEALRFLERFNDKVQLAAVNAPSSCTLSGDIDAIRDVERHCAENGIFCRRLRVDMGE
jgi:acyl transferase domain-containing protein